jgi:hypothetical protein
LDIEEKKIYFVISPHINYYHSYRGDFNGPSGFGPDIEIMEKILDQVDDIEDIGLSDGRIRITWDYADTFWSIQLQQEYQPKILDRVIERCKAGKDEVLIGSWSNAAQVLLNSEEFEQQHEWYMKNSMSIGLEQLFKGRIAPYARTQESMFTQGMIEQYNKLGVEGFCLYYSIIPFDDARPFLNPRLNWNQQFGLVEFKSSVSDASMLMIPMYGFGDILDQCSIERWFKQIRKKQKKGLIDGHALLFINFDMDADTWIGIKLPKILQWMPNSGGLYELARAVDRFEFVEFANLLDVVPKLKKLKVHGSTVLREDVADGCFNGFYNWSQKYINTKFWTFGQRARWIKCISDTLKNIKPDIGKEVKSKIDNAIRNDNDQEESYIKNKLLLSSTTNFGMSMPFMHSHRHKTTGTYLIRQFKAANLALDITLKNFREKLELDNEQGSNIITVPIVNRGISEKEKYEVESDVLVKIEIPENIIDIDKLKILDRNGESFSNYSIYKDIGSANYILEMFVPKSLFNEKKFALWRLLIDKEKEKNNLKDDQIKATSKYIKNKYINLKFDGNSKISSLIFNGKEYAFYDFLESAISFGKSKNPAKFSVESNDIEVLRNGDDGFSAALKINSIFSIMPEKEVRGEKIIKLYNDFPGIFVSVNMNLPDIRGGKSSKDFTSSVMGEYDERWQEIMPCEIKPNILGEDNYLRIWKHNFLGYTSYFDLDMREVDKKNADIDCLVANISDGWMALSNRKKGILVGFNSLKSANFAFTPIKVRDKGFEDNDKKAQQIRINPFGTYWGKMLHHWTNGTGHAQSFATKISGTYKSTAPTYSGKNISFDLVIIPYEGDEPPRKIKSFATHFTLPPLILIQKAGEKEYIDNVSEYKKSFDDLNKEYELEDIIDLSYMDWVKLVNQEPDTKQKQGYSAKLGILAYLKLLIDGIRGKLS